MEGTDPTQDEASEPIIINKDSLGDDQGDDLGDDLGRYPVSYRVALNNRLDIYQIGELIKRSPIPLFVYGSLQLPELVVAQFSSSDTITELALAQNMVPGKLFGYTLFAQRIGNFPAILDTENPEDVVTGMVIFGMSEGQRQRLDRYEGGWYSREMVNVNIPLSSGEHIDILVFAYIWAQSRNKLISPSAKTWSLDEYMHSTAFDNPVPLDYRQATNSRAPTTPPPHESSSQTFTSTDSDGNDLIFPFDQADEEEFARTPTQTRF